MAETAPNVSKKFNTTLIIVFVLIVLIVGYFMYEKYQAKKLQDAQAEDEMKKLKESKDGEKKEAEKTSTTKKEKSGEKAKSSTEAKTETKSEVKKQTSNPPVEEVKNPVLLVEENPNLNESAQENKETLNSGNEKTEPLIIEETASHFIGKEIFVSNRDIRVFAEPDTKSVAVAQFKSTPNGNKLFIGKIERVFVISDVRWFYIKLGSFSEGGRTKGYVKERFVDVKIEA